MAIIANWILLIATGLFLIKLFRTNHWTWGKKNLVAIVISLFWKISIEIAYLLGLITIKSINGMLIANLPLSITMIGVLIVIHTLDD